MYLFERIYNNIIFFLVALKLIMQLCIWMNCQCSPAIYGWVVCAKIQHANDCIQLSTLRWTTISNTVMCMLHNFLSCKFRFSHTSTVTRARSTNLLPITTVSDDYFYMSVRTTAVLYVSTCVMHIINSAFIKFLCVFVQDMLYVSFHRWWVWCSSMIHREP